MPMGYAFMLGSDACFSGEPLICTPNGSLLAFVLPIASSGLGLLVGTLGCWTSRRYSFAWLAAGYLIALAGYYAGYVIAQGAE